MSLPETYSVTEVADTLGQTAHYVRQQARAGRWPHMRGAQNVVRFTVADVDSILALCHREATGDRPNSFLTARSQRNLTRRRTGT